MIADFDIDVLKKDLQANLILVEKQISNYSNKFKIKLSNYLKEKRELAFLNKITYKIQNEIIDNLNNFLNYLTEVLNENKDILIIDDKLNEYISKNEFSLSNNTIYNLNINEDILIESINEDEINIVKKVFESYKRSLKFVIKSLNKKVYDLVKNSINDFNKLNDLMKNDEKLLYVLSFFNILYDKRKNNLYINDNDRIISILKVNKNSYKINNKINLLIKYEKNKFWIALDINKKLVKIISYDNKNDIINFSFNKKEKQIVSYKFNSKELSILLDNHITNIKIDNLNFLSDNIKKEINKIDISLLNFLISFK